MFTGVQILADISNRSLANHARPSISYHPHQFRRRPASRRSDGKHIFILIYLVPGEAADPVPSLSLVSLLSNALFCFFLAGFQSSVYYGYSPVSIIHIADTF